MMRLKSILLLSLLCIMVLAIPPLYAQEDEQDSIDNDSLFSNDISPEEVTSNLTIGNSYNNRVVFWGRQFGIKQYGVYPYMRFDSGNGWYLYAVGLYWSAIPGQMSETDIGIGYEKQITPRFYASAGYERWIVHYGDSYDRNILTNYLEAYFSYDVGPFYVDPAFYYMFGMEHAFVSDISINAYYPLFPSLSESVHISTLPEVVTTFATHSFIQLFGYTPDPINEKGFKLAGFEVNVPITTTFRNFALSITPHYNIPVEVQSEQIDPFFYVSLDLNYTFSF